MRLLIKNMVCRHCVATLQRLLSQIDGLTVEEVGLGYAEISPAPDAQQMHEIVKALTAEGFELILSREAETVERIKRELIEIVWSEDQSGSETVSERLADRLAMSYSAMGRVFTQVEGRTIENFLIQLRVERVKELIRYHRLTMSEIADRCGYSSVAHMSRMFKQVTGMTPTEFRTLGRRRSIAEL